MNANVVLLSGGTGGAKLAAGLQQVLGDDLTVIANTGDDIEIYDAYVSPDPDLITFWLADLIDERGWGIRGDSFQEMDRRRANGEEIWFNLGDRDLEICLQRKQALDDGQTLTQATVNIAEKLGLKATVLPMTDDPVRTEIHTGEQWISIQQFLIAHQGKAPIEQVRFHGIKRSSPTNAVLQAIANADAIVIGPSNPVISIEPILTVPGLRAAIERSPAPTVAVCPIVRGEVLKGPTAGFMNFRGLTADTAGFIELYREIADGFVVDQESSSPHTLTTDIHLSTVEQREQLAREVVEFALTLTPSQTKER